MTTFEVTKGTASRDLLSHSPEPVFFAVVREDDGSSLHFSRYPDEEHWVADAMFSKIGFPVFSNGPGSRCTGYRIADPETAEEFDILVENMVE